MIKLASPSVEVSPMSAKSHFGGRQRIELDQWRVGNPTVPTIPNRYEFIGSRINEMSATYPRKPLKINPSSDASLSTPMWKVALDGFFGAAFLAIIVGVSAWMFCHMTFEFATLGDTQFLEFLRREF